MGEAGQVWLGRRCLPALFLLAGALQAQTGPQILTFVSQLDDSTQQYALYVPAAPAAKPSYPLLISLHDDQFTFQLNLRQVFGLMSRLGGPMIPESRLFALARDPGFLVACPSGRGGLGYQGIAEQDIWDMLADIQRRYPVDPDRISLTGIGTGGGGALRLALTRPDVWAAVAPVSAEFPAGLEELAGNARNVPIRIFHGEQDPAVPATVAREWQKRLQRAGVDAEYVEYPAARQNAWQFAYRDGAIFDWLAGFRRNPAPDRVRLVTSSFRRNSAYWVRIDRLTPGVPATIDARLEGARVTVETSGLDGFTLTPGRAVTGVAIDGAVQRLKRGAPLTFHRIDGRWLPGPAPASAKHAGAEGPIAEAFSGRHIYVYGTQAVRSPEELEARRRVAATAADWSTPRSRVSPAFPVKPDREVTDRDIDSANLILFGDAVTNSVIARFAGHVPLALNPDAADFGLLYVIPAGKRYLVISSGLPWWTGMDEANRQGPGFDSGPHSLLGTFGDFLLFKGSVPHVVVEGRFDRNWKLPPDAAARMRASGTVTIRE